MAWIKLPAVSVANGDIVVSVTGSVDLSSVLSGWALIINGNYVEIKSGTSADGNGNSTLTLAEAWDGSTISNQPAKIMPTSAPALEIAQLMTDTNEFAIAVHNALEEYAMQDKDITLEAPNGETATFASLPKTERVMQAFRDAAGTAYAYDVTESATDTSNGANGQPRVIRKGDFRVSAFSPSTMIGSGSNETDLWFKVATIPSSSYRYSGRIVLTKGQDGAPKSSIVVLFNRTGTGLISCKARTEDALSVNEVLKVNQDTGELFMRRASRYDWWRAYVEELATNSLATTIHMTVVTGIPEGVDVPVELTFHSGNAGSIVTEDYEEGIWTPTLTSSGVNPIVSYSEQTGSYVKVGGLVYLTGRITLNGLTDIGSGSLYISGLPIAFMPGVGKQAFGTVNRVFGTETDLSEFGGLSVSPVTSDSMFVYPYRNTQSASSSVINVAEILKSNLSISFTITYPIF